MSFVRLLMGLLKIRKTFVKITTNFPYDFCFTHPFIVFSCICHAVGIAGGLLFCYCYSVTTDCSAIAIAKEEAGFKCRDSFELAPELFPPTFGPSIISRHSFKVLVCVKFVSHCTINLSNLFLFNT